MGEIRLDEALWRAAKLAREGKRVFVVLHGVPDVMDDVDGFFGEMHEHVDTNMFTTMPPLTWCCYMGFRKGPDGDFDTHASVEVMTPRQFEVLWTKKGGYDEVIHAVLPLGSPIYMLGA